MNSSIALETVKVNLLLDFHQKFRRLISVCLEVSDAIKSDNKETIRDGSILAFKTSYKIEGYFRKLELLGRVDDRIKEANDFAKKMREDLKDSFVIKLPNGENDEDAMRRHDESGSDWYHPKEEMFSYSSKDKSEGERMLSSVKGYIRESYGIGD